MLKEKISKSLAEYFESTTIHGFRYLRVSKTLIERFAWIGIIGTCFILAGLLIWQSIEESHQNPVLTTIETISVKEVPFPAITVDAGIPDPLGHAEKMFNELAFDFEYRNEILNKNLPDGKDLRQVFDPFLNLVLDKMKFSFKCHQDPSYPNYVQDLANIISLIYFKNPESDEVIDQKLSYIAKESLYKHIENYGEIINLITEDELLTFEMMELSQFVHQNGQNCDNNPKAYAFAMMIMFMYVNDRNPYDDGFSPVIGGFGHFFSYFTKLFKSFESQSWFPQSLEKHLLDLSFQFLSNYSGIPGNFCLPGMNSYHLIDGLSGLYKPSSELFWDKDCNVPNNIYRSNNNQCCSSINFDQLDELYFVMKQSLQPISYIKKEDEEIQIGLTKVPFNQYNHSSIPNGSKARLKSILHNVDARIYGCQYGVSKWQTQDMYGCNHFHRSVTTNGFGVTFNAADFWTMFHQTPFSESFHRVMKPKNDQSMIQTTNQYNLYKGRNIKFPKKLGKNNGMYMYLQAPKLETFKVVIHDPTFVPNLQESGFDIEPGRLSTITVTPQQVITSQDLDSNSESERDCRFHYEGSLKLFKEYHQDGCVFECLLERSFEATNCTPWNYPYFRRDQQVCSYRSWWIFEATMADPTLVEQCQEQCPMECTKTLYTAVVTSQPLSIDNMCYGQEGQPYFPMGNFTEETIPRGILRTFEKMVLGKDVSRYGLCRAALKRIALVRINLASKVVTRITRNKRVTITGHIANIGGTLGLFTGISIMSMFELLFWACRLLITLKKQLLSKPRKIPRNGVLSQPY